MFHILSPPSHEWQARLPPQRSCQEIVAAKVGNIGQGCSWRVLRHNETKKQYVLPMKALAQVSQVRGIPLAVQSINVDEAHQQDEEADCPLHLPSGIHQASGHICCCQERHLWCVHCGN